MKITIVIASKNGDSEAYYEPRAPRWEIKTLRGMGWAVKTRRVDAVAEIDRLRKKADETSRASASLKGASSAHYSLALMAGSIESMIQGIQSAQNGVGTLTTPARKPVLV